MTTQPNTHVLTLTDDLGREYEAYVREEIQEVHRPRGTVNVKFIQVEAVKYRGREVKRFSELAVLNDLETQINISAINLEDYEI